MRATVRAEPIAQLVLVVPRRREGGHVVPHIFAVILANVLRGEMFPRAQRLLITSLIPPKFISSEANKPVYEPGQRSGQVVELLPILS